MQCHSVVLGGDRALSLCLTPAAAGMSPWLSSPGDLLIVGPVTGAGAMPRQGEGG